MIVSDSRFFEVSAYLTSLEELARNHQGTRQYVSKRVSPGEQCLKELSNHIGPSRFGTWYSADGESKGEGLRAASKVGTLQAQFTEVWRHFKRFLGPR
jgi:hypothetical protein